MQKLEQLYEGKAKKVFKTDDLMARKKERLLEKA